MRILTDEERLARFFAKMNRKGEFGNYPTSCISLTTRERLDYEGWIGEPIPDRLRYEPEGDITCREKDQVVRYSWLLRRSDELRNLHITRDVIA